MMKQRIVRPCPFPQFVMTNVMDFLDRTELARAKDLSQPGIREQVSAGVRATDSDLLLLSQFPEILGLLCGLAGRQLHQRVHAPLQALARLPEVYGRGRTNDGDFGARNCVFQSWTDVR